MLKDYLINAAMLIAFVSVIYQIFRNSGLNPLSPLKFKIFSGGIWGLLGITLMVFSVHISNNLIIDFRHIALFLSAISGGSISAIISALIISTFRLLFYGINLPSITAVIVITILTIIFCIIVKLDIKNKPKWILSTALSALVSCIAFNILIAEPRLRYKVMVSYCISLASISFLMYLYMEFNIAILESYIKYKQESKHDFLTGLNNVRQFDNIYNEIVNNSKDRPEMVSLLYIDIDFFKKVNDTYGHAEGDVVLRKLGCILTKSCRNTDIISRNGGEEFSVILLNCPPKKAMEIAENIRKSVETTPIELSNQLKINITISIGVASYPNPTSDFSMLRERADMALYEAKRTGRNKVIFSK